MLTADVAFKLMSLCGASVKVPAGGSVRFSKSTTYSALGRLQCTTGVVQLTYCGLMACQIPLIRYSTPPPPSSIP